MPKVREEAFRVFECQVYVCAKQIYNMYVVSKHVDVIVTDSPLILSQAYNNNDEPLNQIIQREYHNYKNIDIFLNRTKPYNPKGRYQTEDEAKLKDIQIKGIIENMNIPYLTFNGDKTGIEPITTFVLEKIKNIKSVENIGDSK